MPRIDLRRISRRDLALVGIPALALVAAAFWIAYQFVRPAPPDKLVMTTGDEEGGYHGFALRYQEILARHGITLELRTSSGSIENLKRLNDDDSGADIGFVQSGTGDSSSYADLVALGSVYYEPVWVFYRGRDDSDRLANLRGLRIAIGPPGSGTRRLASQLLEANGALAAPTRLVDLGGAYAAQALMQGKIDAMFTVGPAEMPLVRSLLLAQGVRLRHFSRAPAYTRLFPFLALVKLPEGGIDLARNIPARDTMLLAPTANVVARWDVHPALIDLMLQAMHEVHKRPGLFHQAGDFPKVRDHDFPVSPEAERFYKSGPPFLQRYLPFWAATLFDRIFVLLLPLIAVLIPVLRYAPALYSWRVRSGIVRWYGELKLLELEIKEHHDPAQHLQYLKRLNELEEKAFVRPMPLHLTDQVYNLRQHIDMVRASLGKLPPPA